MTTVDVAGTLTLKVSQLLSFAAETLNVSDGSLQTRGYPTLRTGHYIAEPVYADLVRTALHLGYKVIPYECTDAPPPRQASDPTVAMNIREQGQAKNLKEPETEFLGFRSRDAATTRGICGNPITNCR